MGASELRAKLFAAGLRAEDDGEHVVVKALKAADPASEITVVSRPGWHLLAGLEHPVFVAPTGEIVGATKGSAIELSAGVRLDGRATAGTLQGWQEAVAAATGAANCPHFILGLLSGFAGPIQGLVGFDSCGINLSGLSSSGKTLSQRLAVSVWSSTGLGSGLLQSLRTTENAVESIAQSAAERSWHSTRWPTSTAEPLAGWSIRSPAARAKPGSAPKPFSGNATAGRPSSCSAASAPSRRRSARTTASGWPAWRCASSTSMSRASTGLSRKTCWPRSTASSSIMAMPDRPSSGIWSRTATMRGRTSCARRS